MNTRHAVIDSPLGELTLVADGGALIGLYFRHHWYRPPAEAFGPRVDAKSDALLAEAQAQLDRFPGRRPDGVSICRPRFAATICSDGSGTG